MNGSITSVQAVYVPADDITDPAPATTFLHLDASTVLSRKLVELGLFPAVDPLESNSKGLDPEHRRSTSLFDCTQDTIDSAAIQRITRYHCYFGSRRIV